MTLPMYYGASANIRDTAKELRGNQTISEKETWRLIESLNLPVRFRRQHPIDVYIVDFYCHKLKLVIEVDGEIHKIQPDYDDGRTIELEKLGLKVIRFSNEQIKNDQQTVETEIKKACARASL